MAIRIEVAHQHAQLQQTVSKTELTERIYARMEAAGIWTDADTRNRILYELLPVIDALSIVFGKSADDQATLTDLATLTLTKLATDSVATADTSSMWFGLTAADSAVLVEAVALSVSQVFTEATSLNDTVSLHTTKIKADVATLSDDFNRVVNFYRNFLDTIALDDFSNVDKYFDGSKHNVAAAVDAHYWATTKVVEDTFAPADIAAIATTRPVVDELSSSDASNWAFTKGALDTVSLAEAATFDLSKLNTDTSTLIDQASLHPEKPITDGATASDAISRSAQFERTFLDTVALDDSSNIDKYFDATKSNAATATDAHYWATSKIVSDEASVTELAQIATTRPASDGFSSSDFSNWAFTKGQLDTVALVEATSFDLSKLNTDTNLLLDQAALSLDKPLSENTAVSDVISRSAQFERTFLDTVALDDVSNIDKYFEATKNNVATAIDTHHWATSKGVADISLVTELAQIATTRPLAETVATSDSVALSAQFLRDFVDTVALDDLSNVDKNWDATKHNVTTLSDITTIGITTSHSDSAFVQEAHQIAADKALTEFIGMSDVLVFQISSGSIPVFNGVTFNSSTFG